MLKQNWPNTGDKVMRKPYVSLSDHRAVMVCRTGKSDRIGGSLGKELVTEEKLRGRGHIRE